MDRRSLLSLLPTAWLAAPALAANPMKIVVPFAPGGATDILARLLAPALSRELGQTVLVENRAGGGGSLAMAELARAPADGLTLGMATVSTHGVNPVVARKAPYDALRDFVPVIELARAPGVLVVSPSLPVKKFDEFLAHARAHPGKLTYGTPGIGSAGHMVGERLKAATRVHIVHIPYRGAAGVVNDLMVGVIDIGFDQVASSLPHIQAGRLRPLVVSWPARLPMLPDVPTYAEVGLPQNNEASWFGIVAPAGLPPVQAQVLQAAFARALAQPEVKSGCEKLGLYVSGAGGREFGRQIATTVEQMRETARSARIVLSD